MRQVWIFPGNTRYGKQSQMLAGKQRNGTNTFLSNNSQCNNIFMHLLFKLKTNLKEKYTSCIIITLMEDV